MQPCQTRSRALPCNAFVLHFLFSSQKCFSSTVIAEYRPPTMQRSAQMIAEWSRLYMVSRQCGTKTTSISRCIFAFTDGGMLHTEPIK
jgi:hypothetical protein